MASASLDPLEPLAGRRILVAGSGSIAAVKLPQLVSALVKRGANVLTVAFGAGLTWGAMTIRM